MRDARRTTPSEPTHVIAAGAGTLRVRRSERLKSAAVALVFIAGIAAALWWAAVPEVLKHMEQTREVQATPKRPDARSGRIVVELPAERCRELAFDNVTGAMQDTNKPCSTSAAATPTSPPAPQGTMRRMEAISKAFTR
jgi:hypothetical protein